MKYRHYRRRWESDQLYEMRHSVARRHQITRELTEALPPSRPVPRPAPAAPGLPNAEIIPIAPFLAERPEAA